jgi:hypothetical protein
VRILRFSCLMRNELASKASKASSCSNGEVLLANFWETHYKRAPLGVGLIPRINAYGVGVRNIIAHNLCLPKAPSDLKTQRLRSFVGSCLLPRSVGTEELSPAERSRGTSTDSRLDFEAHPVYTGERAGTVLISLVSRCAAKSH